MLQVCVQVPLQRCKQAKSALEHAQVLQGSVIKTKDGFAVLGTNLDAANEKEALLLLHGHVKGLDIAGSQIIIRQRPIDQKQLQHSPSPLLNVLHSYGQLPDELLENIPGFERYDNFLLFQCGAFQAKVWQSFLMANCDFHEKVALAFRVTHTAAKSYIQRDDYVRKPRVVPLHGDFGFHLPPSWPDLFWATTSIKVRGVTGKEGRVHYTWSPAHTMYSRGNLCEKERVANLPNLEGRTVVDLYGGVGYWVYPYLFAGVSRVFACDVNPYSIEGMRRAAEFNNVSCAVSDSPDAELPESAQLVILPFDNKLSGKTLKGLADIVSLGLLPHAKDGFVVALEVLTEGGGVLRIHEEVAIPAGDKSTKDSARLKWATETAKSIEKLDLSKRKATVSHVSRIKTLGKELEHLVADVRVES